MKGTRLFRLHLALAAVGLVAPSVAAQQLDATAASSYEPSVVVPEPTTAERAAAFAAEIGVSYMGVGPEARVQFLAPAGGISQILDDGSLGTWYADQPATPGSIWLFETNGILVDMESGQLVPVHAPAVVFLEVDTGDAGPTLSPKTCQVSCGAGHYSCCKFGSPVICYCVMNGMSDTCNAGGPGSTSCSVTSGI
jgi:hypothetical protein